MPMRKILLVEDERIIAMDVRARLEAMGYEVPEVAYSGEEAISAARIHRPDLVLMDIVLPGGIDGIEAAARVRSELGTPVVFMSAYADQQTVQRSMESDPFGYIIKPFDERAVRLGIDIAIHRHQSELALMEDGATRTRNASGMIACILSSLAACSTPEAREALITRISAQFDERFRSWFRKALEGRQNAAKGGGWGSRETAGFYLRWLVDLLSGTGMEAVWRLEGNTGSIEVRRGPRDGGTEEELLMAGILGTLVERSFGWTGLSGEISRAPGKTGGTGEYRFEFVMSGLQEGGKGP